jgi:alpha-L-fucosidase
MRPSRPRLFFPWILLLAAALPAAGRQPSALAIPPGLTADSVAILASRVVPSPRQLDWQRREVAAFLHFGMNTFTDREWGTGTEDPRAFDPTAFDARQWIATLKEAGVAAAIITAKHHDGFCLWPTSTTDHSVRSSPWRGGKGDVVREVSAACREYGLAFGFYLSPWDRHEPSYGSGERYNEYFRAQLRELLSNYGEVAEVWFDGANGEGPNGKTQSYDWASYYRVIRELQPNAVIFGMGPDVRWVGTESGVGRETEWSVVPVRVSDPRGLVEGDHPLDAVFLPGDMTGDDLGSRARIDTARVLAWYPAETDVSIRPGWFYHAAEDARVKSPEELVDIYHTSVGRNGVLLLNVPPDRRGLIAEPDRRSLLGMRRLLDATYGENVLEGARFSRTAETVTAEFDRARSFDRLVLAERIAGGQRIEAFRLEAWEAEAWRTVAAGTTIGAKRILLFPETSAEKVRLVVTASRGVPDLATIGLYLSPPEVGITPQGALFTDSIAVTLWSARPGTTFRYTLDGRAPGPEASLASGPVTIASDATLTAVAVDERGVAGKPLSARFLRSRVGVSLRAAADPRYGGDGPATLVDAVEGSTDHADGRWLGFEGSDLDALVDLASVREVGEVRVGFLAKEGSWIFLPYSVTLAVSDNGVTFRPAGTGFVVPEAGPRRVTVTIPSGVRGRFVRVLAATRGLCPPGHPGEGKKCWLFVDEISILTR